MKLARRKTPLAALIIWLCLVVGAVSQSPPDFSGQWVAEPDVVPGAGAGGVGTQPQPPRGTMGSGWGSPITIAQTATQIIVEHQMFSRYDLQPPLRHIYALDGSETQYSIMISHSTQVRRSRAVWKGGTLEITTMYPATDPATGKPFTAVATQRLTLESPTTLIVETTRDGALGAQPTTSRTLYRKG